jgi:predicted outer membrane repeat protein
MRGYGIRIYNSTIEYNLAEYDGGGIHSLSNLVTISSTIGHNRTTDPTSGGGGIYQGRSSLIISQTLVLSNTTGEQGGGVFHDGVGGMYVRNSVFAGNQADFEGGGIYLDERGGVLVEDSAFRNNRSSSGGAIALDGITGMNINRSTFSDNQASENGGALYLWNGNGTDIYNSTFSGNHAAVNGGALYSSGATTPGMVNTTIVDNSAAMNGGGIYADTYAFVQNSLIAGNRAGGNPNASSADCEIGIQLHSGGHNLFGESTGCENTRFDQTVVPVDVLNSVVEPLTDNGGAILPDGSHPHTHALPSGSPAVDAGQDRICPSSDQRGDNPHYRKPDHGEHYSRRE